MPTLIHQRQQQQQQQQQSKPLVDHHPPFPSDAERHHRAAPLTRSTLAAIFLLIFLGAVISPRIRSAVAPFPTGRSPPPLSRWRGYSLADAAAFVARNGTIIVCAVSQPYLPFLSNWLVGISRHQRHHQVLVIAEDYATLDEINRRWPGHAVLVPPVPESQEAAHKFGSQGFFNFTSRRPLHLLQILELGYNVMYNDVDMVWLRDPFPYLEGNHDVYFTDDMPQVMPLNHSHALPPPGKRGRTYICSCMIFLRPTGGAKLLMEKWVEELQAQPWSPKAKANDQPAFNWALNKTAGKVDVYLLPQASFPTGGLYFKNKEWAEETKGLLSIIHNNYITGFEKKIKRFREYKLWFLDDCSDESPLGRIQTGQ